MYYFYKKSFTLIELLISIALTAIIMTFLFQSMHNVGKTNKFYKTKLDEYSQKNQLILLLYNDILLSNAHGINKYKSIKHSNIAQFTIKSKHSIKGFSNPYISYVLYKKEKIFFRLESNSNPRLPLTEESIMKMDFNRFDNVSMFSIYQNKKAFLVYFIHKKEKEFFQISKL